MSDSSSLNALVPVLETLQYVSTGGYRTPLNLEPAEQVRSIPLPKLSSASPTTSRVPRWAGSACLHTALTQLRKRKTQQNSQSLPRRISWKIFIAVTSATTQRVRWAALESIRKERSMDGNSEGGILTPLQAWPPSQVVPEDWRRTCCPPTGSFF